MTNQSIKNAFERFWQHTVAKVGEKADIDHVHTAEDIGADVAGSADGALNAAKAYTDGEITEWVGDTPVSTQINTAVANLLENSTEAVDSIYELRDAMQDNADAISALETIAGSKASASDLTSHTGDKNNPHGVTAEQVGAYTKAEVNTALNKKANDYSMELYNGTSGNPKPVKFLTIDYSTCSSEAGVAIKLGLVSGHGNGSSYAFLQDAIIKVTHTGVVQVDNFKYYGASVSDGGVARQYGDIFWVIDTTNKVVDFYVLMGQYVRIQMTPYKRVTYSTGGTITQYTSCTVYSSGEKVWANNSKIALMSDIPTVPTKTSELTNDSGFLTQHQDLSDYYTGSEVDSKFSTLVGDTPVVTQISNALNAISKETWTFTLEDGSTVDKVVYVG